MTEKFFCIIFFLLVIVNWAYSEGKDITREAIIIEPFGLALGITPGRAEYAGLDIRIWYREHGLEYYPVSGSGIWCRSLKYMYRFSGNNYFGLGVGEVKEEIPRSWTVATDTKYTESVTFLFLGTETPWIFDWLTANAEIGYLHSNVTSFSGEDRFFPKDRLLVSAGLRVKIRV